MVTVRLNASYFPAVEMLSGVALAVIVLYGGYQAIDGHDHASARSSPSSPRCVPVRTDPAALPALHHLPVRDGRAREDLPAARRQARAHGPPGRPRARPDPRRGQLRGRLLRLPAPRVARGALNGNGSAPSTSRRRSSRSTASTCRSPRARRSRWSARPARASRRWPSSSPASTTRPAGACSSTGTTCARSPVISLRSQMGIVPRRRSCSPAPWGEHRLRSARRRGRADPCRGRRRGRRGVHRRARTRLRHRGRRARRPAARPASAS